MKVSQITSCYIGPEISPEQFIAEHFFLYLISGTMMVYDGNKEFQIKPGDYGLARRNYLAKYNKQKIGNQFEKVIIAFDQEFLKNFSKKYNYTAVEEKKSNAIHVLKKDNLIQNFVESLSPYYDEDGKINETFSTVKREELLLILLKTEPELANIFFDFGIPEKIDLEEFMNRNFRFNISLERFAYLTGRSLSTFKRDFNKTFHNTPSNWLIQKRLNEAYFLIEKKNKKPSEIYLDLGFEDLSHFSFAFKKLFGQSPSALSEI
ncbi:AraC-like DNA-binding protein [Flavobacterium sp. 270]|uniref:helix-turn-helix domain-containing protein n=1 Tax=Flavobacterium sp. 270 TaxID=2512114 RepID=UPI001067136F|nr:helix-turn-helix domain-containing protein [Flavobacterium sp. 270]TDW51831.1 AraC-like DNA-binding protein [Flavobacterium sp. 270]